MDEHMTNKQAMELLVKVVQLLEQEIIATKEITTYSIDLPPEISIMEDIITQINSLLHYEFLEKTLQYWSKERDYDYY